MAPRPSVRQETAQIASSQYSSHKKGTITFRPLSFFECTHHGCCTFRQVNDAASQSLCHSLLTRTMAGSQRITSENAGAFPSLYRRLALHEASACSSVVHENNGGTTWWSPRTWRQSSVVADWEPPPGRWEQAVWVERCR